MQQQARGSEQEAGGHGTESGLPRVRVSAVLSVAAAAAIVLWQALEAGSSPASSQTSSVATGNSAGLSQTRHTAKTMTAGSEQQLIRLARTLDTPVYWRGPQQGSRYAVTTTRQGWVYVSYLPPGAKPPTDIHQYPSVVTYPFANAYAATRAVARKPGSVRISVPAGEVAFYYRSFPMSAYLALSGVKYQIEVSDPSPERVRGLISSGQIRPIPTSHP